MLYKKNLIILIVLSLFYTLQADTKNHKMISVQQLPPGVSIYQLDNGLQVLLIENKGLPMIGVNVVVKTGSAYETFSSSGMSHMLEHLLFNGTTNRTQEKLYDDVDLIGGYNNANTGKFYTNYMMVTPVANIKKGMEIQADMLFNSILPEDKFEKEKGIVLEEIARSLENSDEQIERSVNTLLFDGHALSLPTLGTYATIESMDRNAVYEYYKNTYVPNNMIMSVIGNFTTDSMRIWIDSIYGKGIPSVVRIPVNANWKTGFEDINRNKLLSDKTFNRFYKGENHILQLYYNLPVYWGDAHFDIMGEVLSKSRSDIMDALKDKYKNIESSLSTDFIRTPIANYFSVSMVSQDIIDWSQCSTDINKLFKNISFKLPKESIDYLATSTKTTFFKNIEKPHMFGIYNAHLFAEKGIETVLLSYEQETYSQAAGDMNAFQLTTNPIIMLHSPFLSSEDEQKEISSKPQVYNDSLTGMQTIAEQNVNSNLLAVHFLLKYKAQYESKFGKDAAKILHDCLGQRLNSVTNQKMSNQYGLTYKVNDNPFIPMDNIYLNPDFSYIRAEGLAEDIPGIVHYLEKQINGFVPTNEEFQKALSKTKRPMMGMGSSQSSKLFENTYRSQIYEEERYKTSTKDLSYDALVKFARAYFHPSNMIISVVSPKIPEKVFNLFQWKAEPLSDQYGIIDVPYVRQLKVINAPVKKEIESDGERSFLFWGYVRNIEDSDKPALEALGLLLSDHIVFEIREKQGRAYRMKAGIDIVGSRALFYINLGTRPENIDAILEQTEAFFNKETVELFNDFKLQKSLNMYLGRMMFRRLSSINKGYYLGHSEYFHQNIMYDSEFLSKLKTVTLSEIKKVAEKYLQPINPVTVIVR
jgi:predicted Zn-dependent peptidase